MIKAVDRIGERHGLLTVIAKVPKGPRSHWECRCDCGRTAVVSNSNIATGNSKSCGCERERSIKGEMIGARFGSLVVKEQAGSKSFGVSKFALYKCSCDCGGEIVTLGSSLRSGDTKSCGCAYQAAGAARRKPAEHKRAVMMRSTSRRRAAQGRALRPFNEELFDLVELEAKSLARLRSRVTGVRHEVDHSVPILGKTVSGLHNEFNLSVIPSSVNRSKGNRYWPDMPGGE